jgi:hypothetical protein
MANPMRWARGTVVSVFLLGLVVVVGPAVWNVDSLFRDPFTGAEERRTVETFNADGTLTGREVTTSPAGGSLIERSLAAGGVLLLRLAVVSAAAYLAGALVYRTMSGTFPSEIGGVKFAEDAAVGLEKADANIALVRNEVAQLTARMDGANEAIERLAEAVVVLGEELRDLRDRRAQ